LVLRLSKVERTQDFTRVEIVVHNKLANTITLPGFQRATLSDAAGATLEVDSFRSSWSETIAPGQLRRGTIIFGGHLADGETTATVAFATIFEQGFDGPSSLVVPGPVIRSSGGEWTRALGERWSPRGSNPLVSDRPPARAAASSVRSIPCSEPVGEVVHRVCHRGVLPPHPGLADIEPDAHRASNGRGE